MRLRYALAATLLAASCATPTGTTPPPPAGALPSTPLDLGDWRTAQPAALLEQFERTVAGRYAAGVALTAAMADLRTAEFTCAPLRERTDREGQPPAQVCRRTVTANDCTHTWQVHLYDTDGNGQLARSRGLYDRRCGADSLLGGPG